MGRGWVRIIFLERRKVILSMNRILRCVRLRFPDCIHVAVIRIVIVYGFGLMHITVINLMKVAVRMRLPYLPLWLNAAES